MTSPETPRPVWRGDQEIISREDAAPATEPLEPARVPIAAAAPTRRAPIKGKRRSGTPLFLTVATFIAIAGIAFAVGRTTAGGSTSANAANDANAFGPGASGALGQPPDGIRGATIEGTVVSVAADHITIQTASGQTVNVATNASTTYHGQTAATSADVATGATVTVQVSQAAPGAAASAAASGGTTTRTATDVTVRGS